MGALARSGVVVMAIGYGDRASESQLAEVARTTGGLFLHGPDVLASLRTAVASA